MRRLALLIAFVLLIPAPASALLPAVSIPDQPGQDAGPEFIGKATKANPVKTFHVPQHPFMARNGTSNIHNDAYMTDAYDVRGPLGRNTQTTSTWLGLEECASITFDSKGRILGLCGSLDGAKLRMLDPTTLDTLAVLPLPPRMYRPGTTPLNDYCAAGYFYLDHLDRGVLSTNLNQVWVVGLTEPPGALTVEAFHDLNQHVRNPDCVASVLPDWSGRLWFLSKAAVVGTIDPETGQTHSMQLDGEAVANSFAVDETGGVFIITDHAMYRFEAAPDGSPKITWRVPYDRGTRLKPGMLSQGSGTTPTIIGKHHVAIADNADPRMHVEVYNRHTGKLVCREPVFTPHKGATENSLIAFGNALIVENNYGYESPLTTADGGTTEPGVARVDFDPKRRRCRTTWTSNEISPTTVPKASLASGLLYLYTKPRNTTGADAWYFTAVDLRNGRTVFRRLTGTGYLYNNHYAPISLGPDGAAYVGVLGGLVRIADFASPMKSTPRRATA